MTDAAELSARVLLLHAAEPGVKSLGGFVREFGAVEACERITAGAGPTRFPDVLARRVKTVDVDQVLHRLSELGVDVVVPESPHWPTQLNDLGDAAPLALLVRGALPLRLAASRSVAIVGARAASEYGERNASMFSSDLGDEGWTVVSGAAYGIDAAAHRGALAVGANTIAVVASGIDVVYPSAHQQLFTQLLDRGLVISECLPGQRPTRAGFLARNRVIAALTAGTVVVEAAQRSGALNTATWAAGLARHVMAVPGSITSTSSTGCHRLIRDGVATLVSSVADITELLSPLQADHGEIGESSVLDDLPPRAAVVFEALPVRGGTSPEALAQTTGHDVDDIVTALGQLLLTGLVRHGEAGWSVVRGARGTPGRAASRH